jgi:putative ABC transport system permease protein
MGNSGGLESRMSRWTLVFRSLKFHARSHLGTVAGAAIGSAALIGALVVGDSLRETLRERALQRLGWAQSAMATPDRLFSQHLKSVFQNSGSGPSAAAVALELPGTITRPDGSARANQVNIFGIDSSFGGGNEALTNIARGTVVLNQSLATKLGVQASDEVIVRCQKPSALSQEAAIASRNEQTVALRLKVKAVVTGRQMGDFSLRANQAPSLNAFLRLDELAEEVGEPGKGNLLVLANEKQASGSESGMEQSATAANEKLRTVPSLDFLGIELRTITNLHAIELRSKRIFLDAELARAATASSGDGATHLIQSLTYLGNLFEHGTNSTPYSMVTAAGPPYTPPDLKADQIILNSWLAEDLHAAAGDEIAVSYFDPESGPRLTERTNIFEVIEVVPMELPWNDRTLMPEFPGLENAESTQDWDAGFPLAYKIRPKDEAYWKQYRGTPKAFISLAAGQKLWGNRFGNLTAIRWQPWESHRPGGKNAVASGTQPAVIRQQIENVILKALNPAALGFRFEPVRKQALQAAKQSQDFGQLFLGFSCFLVFAALLLMSLLFRFSLEQRTSEVGILLSVGWLPKQIRRMFLLEGVALAFLGALIGCVGGLAYAKGMLWGLITIWRSATGTTSLAFHVNPTTLAIGLLASTAIALLTIWLTLRKQARQPARELLAGIDATSPRSGKNFGMWGGIAAGLGAVAIVANALIKKETSDAESFFSAGALLLLAGIGLASGWFRRLAGQARGTRFTFLNLGVRGCARRAKRSLATVGLLACGCFLISAIGVFRQDASQDAAKHSAGTGGFALIGESTLPISQDLNTRAGLEAFGLSPAQLPNPRFVPFRVRAGDDASCLNLNRAQTPRLLGVKPELLKGRFTFSSVAKGFNKSDGWELLKGEASSAGAIPAIGDANSIEWALHKKLGDTLDYVAEDGRAFKIQLVGAVANSILQGGLLIQESEFIKRFPNEGGYKMFLIDAAPDSIDETSKLLSRTFQNAGLELTPTALRLDSFNAVQNTYLGTFQILGVLGLLLGSAGLGIVLLRNVLERRGELGLLTAVGFQRAQLQKLVVGEHAALLGLGIAIGLVAAAVAVLPSLLSTTAKLPWSSLAVTLAAVVINGLLWTWVAARRALSGDLLAALRNE